MSINNRKYIQSTGSLLTRLTEESNNPNFQHHGQQQSFQNVNINANSSYNRAPNPNPNQMAYSQQGYQGMAQYSTAGQHNMYANYNQATNGNMPMFNSNMQTAAATAQLLGQINSKQPQEMINLQQPHQAHQSHRDRRHNQHHASYNTSRDSKKPSEHRSDRSHSKKQQHQQQQQQQTQSSSVTELPETFGLPSNTKKFTKQHQDSTKTPEIILDDASKATSPKRIEETSTDVEIISENYPETKTEIVELTLKPSSDELFKSYLGRRFKGRLAVTSKPQCNFISNFNCLEQLLTDCDYYTTRQRRPYSNLKLRNIYTTTSDNDSETEELNDGDSVAKKLKTKHVIVIDDTNEEMHKPWITPDLIKLIKHRNMLQAKLGENSVQGEVPDEELVKKFKNLRNKVTKLVKKARKDYLTKYIADSKEMKRVESEKKDQPIEPALVASLTQKAPPPPPPPSQQQDGTSSRKSDSPTTKSDAKSSSEASTAVAKITSQLTTTSENDEKNTGSFLKNQNTLMMGMYNQYYNQYIQQYQSQQEEAQSLAQAAAEVQEKATNEEEEQDAAETNRKNYELLQKQAAYYAKQQAAIQTQLEASLGKSAQQLIEEISSMASAKPQKPLVVNQFSHQQQHHIHQHIHHNPLNVAGIGPYSQQAQQQQYQPQPIGNAINTAPNYEPTPQHGPQQPYSMHYNYNMVVS